MASAMHENRSRAESFGDAPDLYDRFRPSYPPELIDDLLRSGAHDVLDVGCGTGIVARLLEARGCVVTGVEADPRMAGFARRKGLDVEVSRFESWDPGERSYDLLVSGQAWHWIEPVAGAAKAVACIRSGGRFAVFWNQRVLPDEVMSAFEPIYGRVAPDLFESSALLGTIRSRVGEPGADPIIGALARTRSFGDVERRYYSWHRRTTTAEWIGESRTASDHHVLDPSVLDELLNEVGAALDQLGGGFESAYVTAVLTAERI